MTYDELIADLEEKHYRAKDDLDRAKDRLVRMRERLMKDENVPEHRVKEAIREQERLQRTEARARAELDSAIADRDEDHRVAELRETSIPTGVNVPTRDTSVRVSHRDVYTREAARSGERSFITDLFRSQVLRDPQASQRLAEHGATMAPQHRDVTTANVAGFTPPAYLTNLFAEYAKAGRPVVNLATPLPLPNVGMEVVVPRITTPTAVGVQDGEGSALTEGSPDDTLLKPPVVTVAGYVDLSRQALERGQLVEEVVLADLAASYNAALDDQAINGTGADGQHLGIRATSGVNAITYTSSSPTVVELYEKLAKAAGSIVSTRYTGPTHWVMNPVTWSWLVSRLDDDHRPFVVTAGQGPSNAMGTTEAPAYGGFAGNLFGVPVVLDGNVATNLGTGTNQTEIYCLAAPDMLVWEDANQAPAQLRFDDVLSATLQVRLLAYGYSAFTAGRQPKAVSIISGTGLAALAPA